MPLRRRWRIALVLAASAVPLGALFIVGATLWEVFGPPPRYLEILLVPDGIVFDATTLIEAPGDTDVATSRTFDWDSRIAFDDLLDRWCLATAPDSTKHLRRPLRVSAFSGAPLCLLGPILGFPQGFEPDLRDTILLDVGGRHPIPLFWSIVGENRGDSRCLLVEDSLTSYFDGRDVCDHLVFAIPTDQPHAPDSLRAAFQALPRSSSAKPLEILTNLPADAPFERLAAALRALVATEPPPAVHCQSFRTGWEYEHLRRIRLKAQGRESLSPDEQSRFIPGFVEPVGSTGSGLRLVGMERVRFEEADARDMALHSPEELALLPLSLATPVKVERPLFASESWSPEDLTWKDFALPPVLEGHAFVLRQVVYRSCTERRHPIWWALYDNGRRSGIWTWSGGIEADSVLPNYDLQQIVGGKDERFALRLRVENMPLRVENDRSNFSTETRTEFEFQATPAGLVLQSRTGQWGLPLEAPP